MRTNQRGCWGEQDMCWWQERKRRMWCKDHKYIFKSWNRKMHVLGLVWTHATQYDVLVSVLSLSHVLSSSPFSCRKTMVVHWFARNMSAKSSSVWASKGQNVPHLSLRSLLTLLSTLSGYTKSSNFTPVWRGTDVVVWKWTPCTTLPQHTKGGAALGQQIPRLLRRGPRGRNEENHLMESGPFWDFVAEFVILQRWQRLVTEDWINQMETNPFFHFCEQRHPGC